MEPKEPLALQNQIDEMIDYTVTNEAMKKEACLRQQFDRKEKRISFIQRRKEPCLFLCLLFPFVNPTNYTKMYHDKS